MKTGWKHIIDNNLPYKTLKVITNFSQPPKLTLSIASPHVEDQYFGYIDNNYLFILKISCIGKQKCLIASKI